MADNFISLGPILDEALAGTTLPETAPEMTEKEKERHERWLKRREEQEAANKKRAEELVAAKAKVRQMDAIKNSTAKKETSYRHNPGRKESYKDVVNDMSREEREELREKEYLAWVALVDKLNTPDANSNCSPDDQNTVVLDKFIRDFDNVSRFCFSFGSAVRPTFLLPDKDNPKTKYRVWKRITDNTVILEFGEQVPTRWDKNSQTRVPVSDGVAKKYFAVKHYDPESQTLKTDLFMYERMEGEFVVMCTKLNEYFSKIMPESRKKFVDFRQFLSKKTRGSFSGKLDDGVNAAISTFIKAGGTSANYKSIHLKQNANAILFDPEGVYFLVNMSHCRAGLLNPEEAMANNTFGFYKKEDKVGARLPAHMAIVEFCDNKVTIVYGA